MPRKFRQVRATKCARALGEAIGRRGANGSGAAHNHIANGRGGFAESARSNYLEFMRQQPLLDQENGVAIGIESDRAKI